MSTGASPAAPRRTWLLLGLALSLYACKKDGATGERAGEVARARCASACASLNRCGNDEPAVERQKRCLEQCAASVADAARAGCQAEQDRALECVSTARIACDRLASTRSALEQGGGIDGCQPWFEELARCSAPCREAGVVRSSSGRLTVSGAELTVASELVSLGCGPPKAGLLRKSLSGSPCQHFSICTQARCPCPGSNAAYAARVCADGRCATEEQACALAPRSVGYDACKGR